LNSRLGARGEEPFESFVPESCDRHITSVTHMVTVCGSANASGGSGRKTALPEGIRNSVWRAAA
jgi:hypothetical protein